jgi:protein-L-isoaspartate(D-aspartate) O-methyltransferase
MDSRAFEEQRLNMVAAQIERRGVRDPRVLAALRLVPRHLFIPPDTWGEAYDDHPIPIGNGQTISQPYIVALMTELLHPSGDETILEIGTGSGYQAAVLSLLVKQVHSIERHASLAEGAQQVLLSLGYANISVHIGDGTLGWPDNAPYQGIIITAAAPRVPQALLDQLSAGGRLVIPVGSRHNQVLQVWQRQEDNQFTSEDIIPVAFVPLLGAQGWEEGQWHASDF